jgi:hypothetical protein
MAPAARLRMPVLDPDQCRAAPVRASWSIEKTGGDVTMGAMRTEMSELEGCPQCTGHLFEALDAAGVSCDAGCVSGGESMDRCRCRGCAEDYACPRSA